MQIKKIVSNLLESNVFVIEKEGQVLIIDSGCTLDKVKPLVENKKVVGVLLTHGHFDHSAYCNEYAKEFNCPIFANVRIKDTVCDKSAIYSEDGTTISDLSKFNFIQEDCIINLGNFEVECIYCPGHSVCCECYLIDDNLFSGDVIFAKSFGRTDLIGSNKNDMLSSLCKLEKVNFNNVYSGHGEGSDKAQQMRNLVIYKRFLTR